jgi:hypothetical protein
VLAFLDNIHQFIIISLNGCLKGSYIAVQAGAFNIGNDLIYNADQLLVIGCLG